MYCILKKDIIKCFKIKTNKGTIIMKKEEFIELIRENKEMIESGKNSKCTCHVVKCKWHGNCYECVMMHRVAQDHLPNCMKPIVKKQIAELAAKLEMHLVDNEPTPDEYWNAVDFLFSEKEKY